MDIKKDESTQGGIIQVTWSDFANGQTIEPCIPGDARAVMGSIQCEGSFGGDVTLEGSNDGTNYHTLKDIAGNDISMNAGGLIEFSTTARYLRPNPGVGVTATSAFLVLRG